MLDSPQIELIPELVTTIIPVFNRPIFLREAVQSVLDQSHRPIEIIIVDDESTDNTPEVIRELCQAYPEMIRSTGQNNSGPGRAREAGRVLAKGEYIQYLDSDDILLPRKFAAQVAALRANPQADVAYCKTYEVEFGRPLAGPPSVRTGERLEELFPHLLSGRIWQTSTPLIRRSLSDRIGPWTDQRQEEDWEYDSRIAALGTKLAWVDEFLCAHRHHAGERAGGNSLGNPTKMRWRYRTQKLLFERAISYGIQPGSQSMALFSRSLFLLSRQCGAASLREESQILFELAKKAAGPDVSRRRDFRIYGALTRVLGWRMTGWLSCRLDNLRATER